MLSLVKTVIKVIRKACKMWNTTKKIKFKLKIKKIELNMGCNCKIANIAKLIVKRIRIHKFRIS